MSQGSQTRVDVRQICKLTTYPKFKKNDKQKVNHYLSSRRNRKTILIVIKWKTEESLMEHRQYRIPMGYFEDDS